MTFQGPNSQSETPLRDLSARKAAIEKYGLLGLALLLAFTLRLYWMLTQAPVVSFEAEYIRVAQNLRAGLGLMSSYGGPETMYAPLYSILIAGFSLVVKNAEVAAHLVSLLFGTLLVLPIFYLTRWVYGVRAAYLGAFLVAVQPLLVARGGSIYTEAVYPTLLLAALYWGIKAIDQVSLKYCFLSGAFFGLSYLTKPEAFAYPIFFAFMCFAMALVKRKGFAKVVLAPMLVVAGFAVVASPYVAYLHAETGSWRLEGKWDINYTTGMQIHSGLNDWQALYGINDNEQERGPLLDPERFAAYTPYPHSASDKLKYMETAVRLNREAAYEIFLSTQLGEPFVLILIAIGLFSYGWDKERLLHEFVLAIMVLSIFVLVITAPHVEFRYTDASVPLMIPWVAKGLEELGRWARNLVERAAGKLAPRAGAFAAAAQLAMVIPMVVVSFADTRTLTEFKIEQSGYMGVKQAGLWLRKQLPEDRRVAAMNSVVPYYSSSTLVQFPYAGSRQTLHYFDSREVNFIVLDGHFSKDFPTIADWLAHGIPSGRAKLVYDSGGAPDSRIEIYRWQKATTISAGF